MEERQRSGLVVAAVVSDTVDVSIGHVPAVWLPRNERSFYRRRPFMIRRARSFVVSGTVRVRFRSSGEKQQLAVRYWYTR